MFPQIVRHTGGQTLCVPVGSYQERNTWVLEQAIDSINAQQPDMIVFTGDLLNIQPSDLYPHIKTLSKLKAKDGVFSVLGNHDYAEYLSCDEAIKVANCKETRITPCLTPCDKKKDPHCCESFELNPMIS